MKSYLAHFLFIVEKPVSQLAKALSVCMLPITSKIFPMRGQGYTVVLQGFVEFSLCLLIFCCCSWIVRRTLAAEQDVKFLNIHSLGKVAIQSEQTEILQLWWCFLGNNFQEVRELKPEGHCSWKWKLFVPAPVGIVFIMFLSGQN